MRAGGRTFRGHESVGASTQETIDALLTAFGAHGMLIEASNEG
jgi:hypothetical protein